MKPIRIRQDSPFEVVRIAANEIELRFDCTAFGTKCSTCGQHIEDGDDTAYCGCCAVDAILVCCICGDILKKRECYCYNCYDSATDGG